MKKLYITSPLYYVNAAPHIGHAYTQVACDTASRFFGLAGRDVYFMTGTDEHGEKIEEAAERAGFEKGRERDFVDSVVPRFTKLWKDLEINYDRFIRTTDPLHERTVKKFLEIMQKKGDIYKGEYRGWFCTPCETFYQDEEVREEACPDCGRPLERIEEKNYFFKLSKYQDWLIGHIKKHKGFIGPEIRRNEVLSFLKNPLKDLCVTRPKKRMSWGIDVPFDRDFVTYVWFDALINYVSGLGYADSSKNFKKYWPADFHIIGKDILRHHAVYWPIMLKAVGIAPPDTVFAHGWWTIKGEKVSKSKGNIVNPETFIKGYGADAFRYFLLSEVAFGLDGSFSEESFIMRFNSDLANDLGNLLNRTLAMVMKYFSGSVPAWEKTNDATLARLTEKLKEKATSLYGYLEGFMENLRFNEALSQIWVTINAANKYIEESKPWEHSKKGKSGNIKVIIRSLLETLRIVSVFIYPFMPATAAEIRKQLGCGRPVSGEDYKSTRVWLKLVEGAKIRKGPPLFPRIEAEKDR